MFGLAIGTPQGNRGRDANESEVAVTEKYGLHWRVKWASEIAAGMEYLHSYNIKGNPIRHGDIKPQNILINAVESQSEGQPATFECKVRLNNKRRGGALHATCRGRPCGGVCVCVCVLARGEGLRGMLFAVAC